MNSIYIACKCPAPFSAFFLNFRIRPWAVWQYCWTGLVNARTVNLFVPNCYKTTKFLFFYFSCKDNSNIAIYPWAWMCWRGIKTEYIWQLSNFNFQGTKTSYQNILSHVAFFATLFKSCECKKLYEIAPKKRFLLEPKEINSIFHGNWENKLHVKLKLLIFQMGCLSPH